MPRFKDAPGTALEGVAGTGPEVQSIQQIEFEWSWWLWTFQLLLFGLLTGTTLQMWTHRSAHVTHVWSEGPSRSEMGLSVIKRQRDAFLKLIDIQGIPACFKAALGPILLPRVLCELVNLLRLRWKLRRQIAPRVWLVFVTFGSSLSSSAWDLVSSLSTLLEICTSHENDLFGWKKKVCWTIISFLILDYCYISSHFQFHFCGPRSFPASFPHHLFSVHS